MQAPYKIGMHSYKITKPKKTDRLTPTLATDYSTNAINYGKFWNDELYTHVAPHVINKL